MPRYGPTVAAEFQAPAVCITDETQLPELRKALTYDPVVYSGEDGLVELATRADADMVLIAIVGTGGLRPALAAIITVSGMAFGRMLGGAVLVESVFSWPGIGEYAYRSALTLDLPAIMGVSLVIAMIYILVNLFIDILYAVIDPRVRLG